MGYQDGCGVGWRLDGDGKVQRKRELCCYKTRRAWRACVTLLRVNSNPAIRDNQHVRQLNSELEWTRNAYMLHVATYIELGITATEDGNHCLGK